MSKLDKLNITGIRSFNTQRGETIQFYTPLTLIVGINGSGKTTIIECLKYVTTGELPPGAKKGGAFIHDPKLLGEKEVMAQTKLQFRSIQGGRMVVTRSLQLTVTKTSRVQKSLEGSLLMDRNGEKTTMSSRVAELDSVLPQYLGVSSAVLDNVIFCHQEDSLWPMSEPSNLKKKFDEIFEAQKYIKAIDNIKQIRKKHNDDLREYKVLEQAAKADRDRAEKARKKSEALSDEIEELRTKCQDLDQKMNHSREAAHKAWKQSESYAKVLGALDGKRIEARNRQSIISDLRSDLKELSEPDDWLERTLQQFDTTMRQHEQERDAKREQWLEWKDEIKEMQTNRAEKLAERGKHEQAKQAYEDQLEYRKTLIKTAAVRHQMRGFDDLTDDTLVEEFLYKIRKTAKDQSSAVDKARTAADAEKQEALVTVNRLTERKKALQNSKDEARQQIALHDRQANDFQRQVDHIRVDEGSRAVIESRIEDLSAALQNSRNSAQSANWETKLTEAKQQSRAREDKRSKLNADLIQGTKRAGEVAKLAHLKQEVKERQRSLQTLMNAHADRIKRLIGEGWDASTVESWHQKALEEASRALSAAERDRDAVARDIEQTQFKQRSIRDEISAKTKQASQSAKSVKDVIEADVSEYEDSLKEAQSYLDFARDESKGAGGLSDYFSQILEAAEEKHVCRVCTRPFKSNTDPALAVFKNRLRGLIKKSEVKAEAADLEAAEVRYKRILDVSIAAATWKKLTDEDVPSLEKELEKHNKEREQNLRKAERHDKIFEERQAARKELDSITRTVSSITRCDTDIASFSNQIEGLSQQQSQQGNIRTLEDIQEEIDSVAEEIRGIEKTISQLATEQSASKDQLHQSEMQLRDLKNDLGTTTSQLEKKASLTARVDEYKTLTQKQRDTIDRADKDIEKLDPEIETARVKHRDISQRWDGQIADLSRESAELSDSVNNLNLTNDQIKSYTDRGGPNQLSLVKRDIKSLEQEVEKADAAQVQLTREISKIEEQLRDSETTKRQYSDNLRYRQNVRALEQLQDEISELASQNAEVDRDRFEEESKHYTDQYHKNSAAREGYLGEMKTKDNQLQEMINDYETDFKDAPRRYKEAHIKVETTKAAVEDLARYGSALDKAIMKFHSIKMGLINEIIGELWQKTYQGTDVDSIMIRSDVENTDANGNVKASTSTTSTRRQYNYRVTMNKQGIEMDMRGRCSAGQKVLACIIIRLALAEVFSVNCGIIALDEPTTNLDRDNISALAKSLHDIIKSRRQQSNFQLIVITHDEDFLKNMDCGDFADYYYRVSRDGAGDSIIERKLVADGIYFADTDRAKSDGEGTLNMKRRKPTPGERLVDLSQAKTVRDWIWESV